MKKPHFFPAIFCCLIQTVSANALEISKDEFVDKVYASWLGQIVGNTYGLCYEFKFIEEPGPDSFPYGYTWTLEDLKKHNGAFSDDDTDIEYMYLTQMEKYGVEPSYYHLAEAWKAHVKERVWAANRVALTLMHAGHYPPTTGSKRFNPQWMQIDPQLVNEIWAITAPGMVDYAVEKSAFAAQITNDGYGIEPTLFYAAMFSAAFFDNDLSKLIKLGKKQIGETAKFSQIVDHVIDLHNQYPNDWKKARAAIKHHYYDHAESHEHRWVAIDAVLNGALGIMALLYGEGDFQQTLDYCCAFGMDADNQAATMCGLLGVMNGVESIPQNLLYPIANNGWEKPFNDHYAMVTREGLKSDTISSIVDRTVLQAERTILSQRGGLFDRDGKIFYKINSDAAFTPPYELNEIPQLTVEVGKELRYPIYTGTPVEETEYYLSNHFPDTCTVENGELKVIAKTAGNFDGILSVSHKGEELSVPLKIVVHSPNLAKAASEVVFNKDAIDQNIEIIRDGDVYQTYYSTRKGSARAIDFYGYKWPEARVISALSFNCGAPNEFCGWFTSFAVEYLKDGEWVELKQASTTPQMNLENSQWLKPYFVDYDITFPSVTTKGIRVVGQSGGIEKDAGNAHLGLQFYTAISELRVYEK